MNIVQFVKPTPPALVEFDVCPGCLCADACSKYPANPTGEAMDAWRAACDQQAKDRGGFRACDASIEYGQKADGEYYPMRNGVWL